jgi:hypothetical protein
MRAKPERAAAKVIASAPRTSRTRPSSPSSPIIAEFRRESTSRTPAAASSAQAIAMS